MFLSKTVSLKSSRKGKRSKEFFSNIIWDFISIFTVEIENTKKRNEIKYRKCERKGKKYVKIFTEMTWKMRSKSSFPLRMYEGASISLNPIWEWTTEGGFWWKASSGIFITFEFLFSHHSLMYMWFRAKIWRSHE